MMKAEKMLKFARSGKCVGTQILAAAILMSLQIGSAQAQSTTGGVHGFVASMAPGVEVTIRNLGTNNVNHRKLGARGDYTLSNLSPGEYAITASLDGKEIGKKEVVEVVAGSSTRVPELGATALAAVTVTAPPISAGFVNPIDVTTTELSTIVPAKLFNNLGQQASATTTATEFLSEVSTVGSGYPRFNGSTGASDIYYVNGFNVTNGSTGISLTGIPNDAFSSERVIGGTSSAQYANVMGGAMIQTVKQGTNRFRSGYDLYFTPPTSTLLRPYGRDYLYPDGSYFSRPNGHASGSTTQNFWASGAILKNKLFFYVMLEDDAPTSSRSQGTTGTQETVSSSRSKRPLVNITWNITDNQQLDALYTRQFGSSFSTLYNLPVAFDSASKKFNSWSHPYSQQSVLVGNYHWFINDNMTLQLTGGRLSDSSITTTNANNSADSTYGAFYTLNDKHAYSIGASPTPYQPLPATDEKIGFRGNFTWHLGDHHISVGFTKYRAAFNNAVIGGVDGEPYGRVGGAYHYHEYSKPYVLPDGTQVPPNTPFAEQVYTHQGGSFYDIERGVHIDDTWNFARNFYLYAGLRRDQTQSFEINSNRFLNLFSTSPRLGLAWDVFGDGSTKLGLTAGSYTTPPPADLDTIGSESIHLVPVFSYVGINPDGTPTKVLHYYGTIDAGSGSPAGPLTLASRNITPTRSYNFEAYLQRKLSNNWQAGVEAKYDTLKQIIDTTCDFGKGSPAYNYIASLGYAHPGISNDCVFYNPGSSLVLTNYFKGDGTLSTVRVPSSVYLMPHVSRKNYQAVFTLTHAYSMAQPWFLNVSYTWSHIYGNDAGLIDASRGFTSANSTTNFSYPQLEVGATGDLDIDARNALKAVGYYKFNSTGIRVGGTLAFNTGTPRACYTFYPNNFPNVTGIPPSASGAAAESYGSEAFRNANYCFNKVTPRGSSTIGRNPSIFNTRFFVAWNHKFGLNDLDLSMSVTNPFNRQSVTSYNQFLNTNGGYLNINPAYGYPAFEAPRSVNFVLRYAFN